MSKCTFYILHSILLQEVNHNISHILNLHLYFFKTWIKINLAFWFCIFVSILNFLHEISTVCVLNIRILFGKFSDYILEYFYCKIFLSWPIQSVSVPKLIVQNYRKWLPNYRNYRKWNLKLFCSWLMIMKFCGIKFECLGHMRAKFHAK